MSKLINFHPNDMATIWMKVYQKSKSAEVNSLIQSNVKLP